MAISPTGETERSYDLASASTALRRRMPELDALRGVAIIAVVLYHALYASYVPVVGESPIRHILISATAPGYLGVELFFVLSGFLITGILLDTRESRAQLRLFYERRARRLLSALLVLLVLLAATGLASWMAILGSGLFVANLLPLFQITGTYSVLWSLGVEEQFYLVWPQAVRHLSRKALFVAAIIILFSQPMVRFMAYRHTSSDGLLFYTWFNLDGLALGALLAIALRSTLTRKSLRRAAILGGVGAVIVFTAGAPFGILSRSRRLGAALFITLMSVIFTMSLALALLSGSSGKPASFRLKTCGRALRFFGEISYGLYLFHLLGLTLYDYIAKRWFPQLSYSQRAPLTTVLTRSLVGIALPIAFSVLSRRTIEEWFLRRPSTPSGTSGRRAQRSAKYF